MLTSNLKVMKSLNIKSITLLFALLCLVTVNSCKKVENFLDKAPGVDLTEEKIFSSVAQMDKFLATIYRYGIHSQFAYREIATLSTVTPTPGEQIYHPTSDWTDESDLNEQGFGAAIRWNNGTMSPIEVFSHGDNRYYLRWVALRQIAVMLKNIDKVPDITTAYKNQVTAEVKTIRALLYLEMVKYYGGVPIVTQPFEPGVQVVAPRNSIEECFNFIVQQCDEAIASGGLPLAQNISASLKGRISDMVPYAIKSKALLYAASSMYNSATPYLSMTNPADNKLVCYGNYDVKRWEAAADAALTALNRAAVNDIALVFDPNNRYGRYPGDHTIQNDPTSPIVPLGTKPIRGNYEASWSIHNNSEIILNYQFGNAPSNYNNAPFVYIAPTSTLGPSWSGLAVLMNHVRKYERLDGSIQTWPQTGTNLAAKVRELDPRYKQSLIYNNGFYSDLQPIFELSVQAVGSTGKNSIGHWMRKMLPDNIRPVAGAPNIAPLDIIFRLNELYLNYAEAKNEADAAAAGAQFGTSLSAAALNNTVRTPNIYDAVNVIRARSGMPRLPQLSQAQFRERVRNERAIELAFDDHRFWDIRRWQIAEEEGVMRGRMEGMRINRAGGTSPNFTYNWELYQHEPRTFRKEMYLHPFPLSEVEKGGLKQNPGW